MPKNIIEKIWDSHVVKKETDGPSILFIDFQLLHEVTSPQAFEMLREKNFPAFSPDRNLATIDHSIPTDEFRKDFKDAETKNQVEMLRKNCRDFGIRIFDLDSGHQGVVHVTGPELGITQPGMTITCGDSHTATHGAFGALAFGIGTTQVSHVLSTSSLLIDRPKTIKVEFAGTPSPYFSAKDAILALIRKIGVQGGTRGVIEYTGEYIRQLSMEERMTICNMSIECGARAGLISPDEITFEWLKGKPYSPLDFNDMKKYWMSFASDENAVYDETIILDLNGMKPIVTWGTTPAQSEEIDGAIPLLSTLEESERFLAEKSLAYTKLHTGDKMEGVSIQHVFIGSCTNGRISDLRIAAKILQGKKIAPGVTVRIVPGSEQVEKQAVEEGLVQIFRDAGADFRRPGCSLCLAMNGDEVPPGERCASTSNRNFIGRQGKDSITHLMSPLMASLAAVTGKITNPEKYFSPSGNTL